MVLQILLIVSLLIQIVAAITAINLTRRTKFNAAWILFFLAIVLISHQLIVESIIIAKNKPTSYKVFALWSTVILSLCVSIGIFYVKKILNYIETINKQRALTERRLLNTIIFTEEKERRRFSKDLHDGMGPLLSSAKMSLSVLSKTQQSEQTKEIIDNTVYVVDQAIKELKDISNNISPTILVNFGVARAINNFISKLTMTNGMKITFESEIKDLRLSGNTEAVLYRVGCELINNAIKHSKASEITVLINKSESMIALSVSDNGVGLPQDIMDHPHEGMGLKNIVSRIQSLDGEVMFDDNMGFGTNITVKVKPQ